MVEKGQLTQSEAKNHPRKHFITRALGVEETAVSYTHLICSLQSDLTLWRRPAAGGGSGGYAGGGSGG